ncbi:hypothetical protein WG907_10200 [Sphingobium sp. AN558]|uniref:hypothetical protein n=1 Tax=Sphingobium sp. AN558 TaxID=3133442 RepID=UPI0030C2F431
MPEDVIAALERLQQFIGRLGMDAVVDVQSGFTVADATLLIGEVEMGLSRHRDDVRAFDR